jgi:hypothetical protein
MKKITTITLAALTVFLLLSYSLFGQQDKRPFLVFVGEKISVDTFTPAGKNQMDLFDNSFIAKYRILQKVYGEYSSDTIEFEVYDHLHAPPPFSTYKTVLLYASRGSNGTWYHEKYMYSDVYKTLDGRWAGPYEWNDYQHEYNKNTSIRPEKIAFPDSISFNVSRIRGKLRREWYPKKYFRFEGDRAYPVMGNYVEELFALKRNGFLKARGIF